LVNTGWSGGPYGAGQRMKIAYTRAMVHAALGGSLEKVETRPDPNFKVLVPVSCPNVPAEVLNPRNTWKDAKAYDERAGEVVKLFQKNFEQFASAVDEKVKAAGPGRAETGS